MEGVYFYGQVRTEVQHKSLINSVREESEKQVLLV